MQTLFVINGQVTESDVSSQELVSLADLVHEKVTELTKRAAKDK